MGVCWRRSLKVLRCGREFKFWRNAVFFRDDFTCQIKNCPYCFNKKGGELHPHHIFNFSDYPELRFAIDNGITFCKKGHRTFHSIFGKIKNNKEQTDSYAGRYRQVYSEDKTYRQMRKELLGK